MDDKLERIDAKMAKLALQRKKVKEKTLQSLSSIIAKNKNDLSLLAGMLLDSENIISQNHEKVEAWREAGKTFLRKGKPKQSSPKADKDPTSNPSL